MVIYTFTKFGADWLIFVDARVLTRKLWMDVGRTDGHRRTVSDHNSSQSTLCSGELQTDIKCVSSNKTIRSNYQMYISKAANKTKDRTIKCVSANLTMTSRSEYQMYISNLTIRSTIELSNIYQQS